MKKNGKIPPHFLYFLENECIEVSNFRSSNFSDKDSYDRMLVKFPYSIKNLEIQVIFDNLDNSIAPDFVLVNEEKVIIKYEDIIRDWVFKESSSLFNALNRIKDIYSLNQEKKLRDEFIKALDNIENVKNRKERENSEDFIINECENIFGYIEELYRKLKHRFSMYKQIPKSNCSIDIILNFGNYSNSNVDEKFSNHIIFSYPIDFFIRSRNINRAPIINIYIPITYDNKFYLDVKTPYFVNISDFKLPNEYFNLSDSLEVIMKFENSLIEHLKEMQIRESFINKIMDANIGFPLEIDTYSYKKFTLYLNFNKNNTSLNCNSSLGRNSGNSSNPIPTPSANSLTKVSSDINVYNFLLHFILMKDRKEVEFQVINCDLLKFNAKKKFELGTSDKEINSIIGNILECIIDLIQTKKSNY